MKVISVAQRWSVFSRCVAAAVGGYAIVSLLHLAQVALWPWERYKAMLFASQTGYLWYTAVVIWCFAARTARRAWLGLVIVALPLLLIDAWYLLQRSTP